MSTTTDFSHLPGRLIVVEGIDGSGKSTQLDLLHKWLRSEGYVTVFTEWNSSPIVRDTTKRGKRKQLLTPMSFSLVHAGRFRQPDPRTDPAGAAGRGNRPGRPIRLYGVRS